MTPRALLKSQITEEMVVREIQERLSYDGIKVFRVRERIPTKTKCGNYCRKSVAGIPDLIGWIPRSMLCTRPVFIECKRHVGADYRPSQIAFIDQARADGCIAIFADCWEDVRRGFKEFGIELPA